MKAWYTAQRAQRTKHSNINDWAGECPWAWAQMLKLHAPGIPQVEPHLEPQAAAQVSFSSLGLSSSSPANLPIDPAGEKQVYNWWWRWCDQPFWRDVRYLEAMRSENYLETKLRLLWIRPAWAKSIFERKDRNIHDCFAPSLVTKLLRTLFQTAWAWKLHRALREMLVCIAPMTSAAIAHQTVPHRVFKMAYPLLGLSKPYESDLQEEGIAIPATACRAHLRKLGLFRSRLPLVRGNYRTGLR